MRNTILVFQDKLGVTPAYRPVWDKMLLTAGLLNPGIRFFFASSYRHFPQNDLLVVKPPRKTPGFNEDPSKQIRLLNWFKDQMILHKANIALIMDPALLFIVNNNWKQATNETLRGGLYTVKMTDRSDILVYITMPINSVNRSVKQRDIAALNDGYADKEEWESAFVEDRDEQQTSDDPSDDSSDDSDSDSTAFWYAPVTIPYGHFCFQADMFKLGRILRENEKELALVIQKS